MRNTLADPQPSHVTALFDDRMLSFALPKGATLGDLAGRLALLDGRQPSTVTVTLGT
jgi:hypothetical protein